ncbi:unnamed protein product [Symbiodinium necroappetens]|uniref:Uncharacterized protein n=1 Tax=Symbiodinium necroappetens TaxID=1628268 RepID=A0A812Y0F1_9DINO|nr:unnamed protein product [Symbiodinium necroappetens]
MSTKLAVQCFVSSTKNPRWRLWKEWLEAQDLGEPGLLDVAPGQPLYLKLIRAMLEAAGGGVGEILERYGEHTAIAALAVIVEDESLDKKRIIHDAIPIVRASTTGLSAGTSYPPALERRSTCYENTRRRERGLPRCHH